MPPTTPDITEQVAAQIRAVLDARGWTHAALEYHAKLASNTVRHWTDGRKCPNLHTIVRVAQALKVSPRIFGPE